MRTPRHEVSLAAVTFALCLGALTACGSSSSPAAGSADSGSVQDGDQPLTDTGSVATADSSAPDSATPDGGSSDTGATDSAAAEDAAPIVINAPDDTWTWVDVPGARCGNGSATGIGVNPHAGATHLLIYLQGGGACFDATSCWGASPTASNMTGYAAADFANDPTKALALFQRTAANPWSDADLVFVPYCTGDIHVGSLMTSLTVNNAPMATYFYGGHNVDADLASLALSYTGLTHIWLSGVSAGGFGSFLNQDFVARSFPMVPVDVIDD